MTTTTELPQIREELAELWRTIKAQEVTIRELAARGQEEDAKMVTLLAAISSELGDEEWPVGLIFDQALDSTPGAKDLLAAIVAIVGERKSGSPHKRLGAFLSQHIGVIGKWKLELVKGHTRAGNIYRVTLLSQLSHGRGAHAA